MSPRVEALLQAAASISSARYLKLKASLLRLLSLEVSHHPVKAKASSPESLVMTMTK